MDLGNSKPHVYTSLVQALTVSFSASDFCRNLVHTVFKDFEATGALICRLSLDSTLVEVGSYGMNVDHLKSQLTTVFDETPIAVAIRKQQPVRGFPGIALPLQHDGVVAGGLLLTFGLQSEPADIPVIITEALQIAGANYLERGRGSAPRGGSSSGNAKSEQTELTSRQKQILTYLDQPLTYAQIGKILHVSESLVKQEAGRVFRFLDVANRKDAVAVAQARDILSTN